MDNVNTSLFQLMRFNILNTAKAGIAQSPFEPAYIYAWDAGLYPAFHENAVWHESFTDQFSVSQDQILELGEYLDDMWMERTPVTFYKLETKYGIHNSAHSDGIWDRVDLIRACRYMYLNRMFDDDFWKHVLDDCPMEARPIISDFKESDIYFM